MKQSGAALLLGLALLTLTACAAVQRGEQPGFPVEQPTSSSETTVLPGQTVYVSYAYPRSAFEDDDEFAPRFNAITLDYARAFRKGNTVPDVYVAAPWFSLKAVDAPAGVAVALLQASIGRVVTEAKVSGASVSVRYREEFRLLYRVSVAPGFRAPATDVPQPPPPGATGQPAVAGNSPDQGPDTRYATLTFTDGRRSIETRLYLKFTR